MPIEVWIPREIEDKNRERIFDDYDQITVTGEELDGVNIPGVGVVVAHSDHGGMIFFEIPGGNGNLLPKIYEKGKSSIYKGVILKAR